jgi:hypothetical protein
MRAVWRYELEPVPDGTRIRETFDYGSSPVAKVLELVGGPRHNAGSIRATLRRLQEMFGVPESAQS